jgi:hypothetical protein
MLRESDGSFDSEMTYTAKQIMASVEAFLEKHPELSDTNRIRPSREISLKDLSKKNTAAG